MRSRHAAVTASQVVSPASIFWAISLAAIAKTQPYHLLRIAPGGSTA